METAGIELEVPLRNNQKNGKPVIRILKKVRKRIETIFSQLFDQFMIQRNYAKSFFCYRRRLYDYYCYSKPIAYFYGNYSQSS